MKKEFNYENDIQASLLYMKDKYGVEFKVLTYEIGDYLSDIDYIRMYTEGMDKEHEYVTVIPDSNEDEKFTDNYFGFLIRGKIEKELEKLLSYPDSKVFLDITSATFPETLDQNSTLEDLYREMPDFWADINIYLLGDGSKDKDTYSELAKNLENWMKQSGHSYGVNLFVISKEYYVGIDRFEQDNFWRFYATHRNPDYEDLFYVYNVTIKDGGVQ